MSDSSSTEFGMSVVRGCLVVSFPSTLYDEDLLRLQESILTKAEESDVTGVIIELSAIHVIDSHSFQIISDTARMLHLLGVRAVLSGIQAGVVVALIDLQFELKDICMVRTLGDGFDLLQSDTTTSEDQNHNEKSDEFLEGDNEADG